MPQAKPRALGLNRLFQNLLRTSPLAHIYESILLKQIKDGKFPEHIGIILDGNRRWATEKGLTPWEGHEKGADTIEDFLDWCQEIGGILSTTMYVFSTENFSRSETEVSRIMELIVRYLDRIINDQRVRRHRIRFKAIGRISMLPQELQEQIKHAEEATKEHDQFFLNLAIAYGGRTEILDAVKEIAREVQSGNLSPDEIDEQTISDRLYTRHLPKADPDLIIRTSGEIRISNFLLWQGAYSELCFIDVYWPAFRKIDLLRVVRVYQQRQRRFGG